MIKVNQLHYTLLIKSLMESPATVYELSEEIGLYVRTCRELMNLFKKHQVVHISGWAEDKAGKIHIPIYSLGYAKDKKRIIKSGALRTKTYRANKKLREMTLSTLQPVHGNKLVPHSHQ